MTPVLRRPRGRSLLAATSSVAAILLVAVAAGAKSAPGGSGKSEAGLEATITTKVRQLTVLTRNITRWGCDRAPSASSVEKCRQLNIQARELTAEVEGLKTQAGSNWTSEKQAAAETSAKKARPLPPRRYTYRQETDPGASYRTVCVRLCDGAYFPVSEVVSPQGFLADEQKCQSSCGVPAKLFYQTPFAEETSGMVALTGESYEELPNAYRYRAESIDNCACKPKPWSLEAKAEYHRRAVVAGMSKEERIVAAGADAVCQSPRRKHRYR